MGSGQSSGYGGVYIQTDLPYCISGTMVTGKIYVQINQMVPAVKLDLEIKGKEKCKWHETRTRTIREGENTRTEHYTEHFGTDHTIFKYKSMVYNFNQGYVAPGQYCFPFAFPLPSNCPASAYFTGNSGAVGYVKYSCKATFDAQDHTPFKDLKYKCRLVVRQVPQTISTNLVTEKTAEIYKCC